ncbi:MAG: hypothetical protein ACRAS9_02225 [Mycoplasma sp.]
MSYNIEQIVVGEIYLVNDTDLKISGNKQRPCKIVDINYENETVDVIYYTSTPSIYNQSSEKLPGNRQLSHTNNQVICVHVKKLRNLLN